MSISDTGLFIPKPINEQLSSIVESNSGRVNCLRICSDGMNCAISTLSAMGYTFAKHENCKNFITTIQKCSTGFQFLELFSIFGKKDGSLFEQSVKYCQSAATLVCASVGTTFFFEELKFFSLDKNLKDSMDRVSYVMGSCGLFVSFVDDIREIIERYHAANNASEVYPSKEEMDSRVRGFMANWSQEHYYQKMLDVAVKVMEISLFALGFVSFSCPDVKEAISGFLGVIAGVIGLYKLWRENSHPTKDQIVTYEVRHRLPLNPAFISLRKWSDASVEAT